MSEEKTTQEIQLFRNELESQIKKRNVELALLKRDVMDLNKIHDKLEITIDKMQQVSVDLSKIITAHEYKIQTQDQINSEVKSRFIQVENASESVEKKIDTLVDHMYDKVETIKTSVLDEVSKIKLDIKSVSEVLSKKIFEIDIWRYMMMGAMILASFLITKFLDLARIFT